MDSTSCYIKYNSLYQIQEFVIMNSERNFDNNSVILFYTNKKKLRRSSCTRSPLHEFLMKCIYYKEADIYKRVLKVT